MIQSPAVHKTVKKVFEVLLSHGVVILPSRLGYRILALSEQGVEKMYQLKNRPRHIPCGVLATPEIFNELTRSKFNLDDLLQQYPVGLIESPDSDHPTIQSLSHLIKQNDNLAFFFHANEFMSRLCEYAWEKGRLITCSSAKKSGTQECFRFAELQQDFQHGADYILEGDDLSLFKERSELDDITFTIIDLPAGKILREGVHAALIKAYCIEKFIITDHLSPPQSDAGKTPGFRSCIFLQSFKQITFDRIKHIRESDWLALDLEDGCPAQWKPIARQLIEQHAHRSTFDHQNIVVRLNGLDHREELLLDLQVKYTHHIRAFALPMLRHAADVREYDQLISDLELRLDLPDQTFSFFPIIETPEGLQHAEEIAKASPRNLAMFLGHADLFGELNSYRNSLNLHTVRMQYLVAARGGGLFAFDTPFEEVKNFPGLEKDAQEARQIGLDGKVALNFEQLPLINTIFSIDLDEKGKLEHILSQYEGGCKIIGGQFIAPPLIKKIESELRKRTYRPRTIGIASTRGKTLSYGLDFRKATPGQIIRGSYEVTLDASWITSWQALVQTGNPLDTSHRFCQSVGLKDRLLPFQLLINLSLCLMVESFSESSLYHLGIRDAVYERPVYPGDTLRAVMIIDQIRPSANKQHSIFMTRLILVNQHNQRVISMKRNSLFEYIGTPDQLSQQDQYEHPDFYLFAEKPFSALRKKLFDSVQNKSIPGIHQQPELNPGDLILHSLTRQLGRSNNLSYSTLYKNTHPLHINNKRYGVEGMVVCGGFIIPIIHGAASRDIRIALDHEIIDTMHINKMHYEDCIGAMTYVLDVKEVLEGIECVTLRTFGLKNVDAERELANSEIPDELLRSPEIKPREIELLCKIYCPELHHKICARTTWLMWRRTIS